jgi:hypothetical protein
MRMRRRSTRFLAVLLAMTALSLLTAGLAHAAVTASIAPKAKILGAGESVTGTVTITCDAGLQVLDATFSVAQGGTDGVSPIAGVVCDGRAHRYKVVVTARSGSGTFQAGDAFAVAFVYAQDPQTGATQRAEETATITLH